MQRFIGALGVGAMAAALVAAGPAAPEPRPADYEAIAPTLSQPDFPETVREVHRIPAHDGEQLYVEVTLPDPAVYGDRTWPVILEASPYHGTIADREGTRIFPDPEDEDGNKIGLTGYFAPRGYAVVMMDLRGTGRSTGCLDHLGPDDAKDLRTVVEWAADQDWSTGKVGMTGHSYVGSTPSVAAAMKPRGLVTIAPSAGLASMYDHQFHHGVPWWLQWVGPMAAYEALAVLRDLPGGDNAEAFPNPQVGCGMRSSALTAGHGQVTGQYQTWHAQRDWRRGAARADIPIFMIHGVNDNAARIPAAEWFFADRAPRPTDKVWIGQWDHGSAGATTCPEAHVNCRFQQWQYALHAWFDKHLQGRDVDTGPTVEAFLNGDEVVVGDRWRARPGALTLYPDATTGTLGFQPPAEAGSVSFTSLLGGGSVEFVSEPFEQDAVFVGTPRLSLPVSVTGQAVHLVTDLRVEQTHDDGSTSRREANYCAINTHLRHSISTPAPVIPGEVMDLRPQCFTMTHQVKAGERLVLVVGTTSRHHVPTFAHDARITVHTGPGDLGYRLPLVPHAQVHPDPLDRSLDAVDEVGDATAGQAQAPIHGSAILVAPSADLFSVEGVTDAFVDFEVEAGFDNARLDVVAEVLLPADVDLILYRRDGGQWREIGRGASFDLAGESLSVSGPVPGDYRLQIQNWAGGPNQVDYVVRFFNRAGEPGEG